jgi:hypothetical protein
MMKQCQPMGARALAVTALSLFALSGCGLFAWPSGQPETVARAPAQSAGEYSTSALRLRHTRYMVANSARVENGKVVLQVQTVGAQLDDEGMALKLTLTLASRVA